MAELPHQALQSFYLFGFRLQRRAGSARPDRPWSAPREEGSLALLRRMEASSVGCDDQLVDLRSVPCEMRAENIFQIYDEQRLAGEDAALYHNGDMLSALGVHVVIGWARAHP